MRRTVNQKNMNMRSTAIALMAVVVFALPLSLGSRNAGKVLFSPEALTGLIEKSIGNPDLLVGVVREALESERGGKLDRDTVMSQLLLTAVKGERARFSQLVIPEKQFSQTLKPVVKNIFTWLDNPKEYPEIRVDLLPLKSHITARLRPSINSLFSAFPPCSPEQIGSLSATPLPGALPRCRIPEPYYARFTSAVQRVVKTRIDELPDEIDITAIMNPVQGMERSSVCMQCHNHGLFKRDPHLGKIGEAKQWLLSVRAWMNNAWIVVFVAFIVSFVMATAGIKARSERLRWAGWPLMLSGAVSLLLAVYFLYSFGMPEIAVVPPLALVAMKPLITDLVSQVGSALLLQAALLLLFGAGALLMAQRKGKTAKAAGR